MFLQSLKKFHQCFFKILRKQNVKDTLSFVCSFVRSDGQTDNVKTVYPPTNTVCGGYNKYVLTDRGIVFLLFCSEAKIVGTC